MKNFGVKKDLTKTTTKKIYHKREHLLASYITKALGLEIFKHSGTN